MFGGVINNPVVFGLPPTPVPFFAIYNENLSQVEFEHFNLVPTAFSRIFGFLPLLTVDNLTFQSDGNFAVSLQTVGTQETLILVYSAGALVQQQIFLSTCGTKTLVSVGSDAVAAVMDRSCADGNFFLAVIPTDITASVKYFDVPTTPAFDIFVSTTSNSAFNLYGKTSVGDFAFASSDLLQTSLTLNSIPYDSFLTSEGSGITLTPVASGYQSQTNENYVAFESSQNGSVKVVFFTGFTNLIAAHFSASSIGSQLYITSTSAGLFYGNPGLMINYKFFDSDWKFGYIYMYFNFGLWTKRIDRTLYLKKSIYMGIDSSWLISPVNSIISHQRLLFKSDIFFAQIFEGKNNQIVFLNNANQNGCIQIENYSNRDFLESFQKESPVVIEQIINETPGSYSQSSLVPDMLQVSLADQRLILFDYNTCGQYIGTSNSAATTTYTIGDPIAQYIDITSFSVNMDACYDNLHTLISFQVLDQSNNNVTDSQTFVQVFQQNVLSDDIIITFEVIELVCENAFTTALPGIYTMVLDLSIEHEYGLWFPVKENYPTLFTTYQHTIEILGPVACVPNYANPLFPYFEQTVNLGQSVTLSEFDLINNGDCEFQLFVYGDYTGNTDLFTFTPPVHETSQCSTVATQTLATSFIVEAVQLPEKAGIYDIFVDLQHLDQFFSTSFRLIIVDLCLENELYDLYDSSLVVSPLIIYDLALGNQIQYSLLKASLTNEENFAQCDYELTMQLVDPTNTGYPYIVAEETIMTAGHLDSSWPSTDGFFFDIWTNDYSLKTLGVQTIYIEVFYENRPDNRKVYEIQIEFEFNCFSATLATPAELLVTSYYVNDPEKQSDFLVKYTNSEIAGICGEPVLTFDPYPSKLDQIITLTTEGDIYEKYYTIYNSQLETFQPIAYKITYTWSIPLEPGTEIPGSITFDILNPCLDALSVPVIDKVFKYTVGDPREYFAITSFAEKTPDIAFEKCGVLKFDISYDDSEFGTFNLIIQQKQFVRQDMYLEVFSENIEIAKPYLLSIKAWFSLTENLIYQVSFRVELYDPCYQVILQELDQIDDQVYDTTKQDQGFLEFTWSDFDILPLKPSTEKLCRPIVYNVFMASTIEDTPFDSWFIINVEDRLIQMFLPYSPNNFIQSRTISVTITGSPLEVTGKYPTTTIQFQIEVIGKNRYGVSDELKEKDEEEEEIKVNQLYAWISEMNSLGKVKIQFSTAIQIPQEFVDIQRKRAEGKFDESLIKEFVELKVISLRNVDEKYLAIQNYTLIDFRQQYLKIQVEFKYPRYISRILSDQELLVLNFKDKSSIISPINQSTLQKDPVSFRIPQQESYGTQAANIALIQNIKDYGIAFGSTSLIFNLIFAVSLKQVWNFVNIIQFLIWLPQWKLSLPLHTLSMLKLTKYIMLLEFIPWNSIISYLTGLDLDEQEDIFAVESEASTERRLSQKEEEEPLEIDENQKEYTLTDNLGVFLFALISIFISIALLYLIAICMYKYYKVYKFVKFLETKIFWNSLIRYSLQSIVKLLFNACSCLMLWDWTNHSNNFKNIICFALILGFIALPFIYVKVLKSYYEAKLLNKPSTKNKIGSLYLGIKSETKLSLSYTFVFLIRRLLFTLITFGMLSQPNIQVQVFIYSTVLYTIYFQTSMPYIESASNKIEIINETLLLLTFYNFVFFTGLTDDFEAIDLIGWIAIGCITAMIVFNFGVLIFNISKVLLWKLKVFKLKRDRRMNIYRIKRAREMPQKKMNNQEKIDEISKKNDAERSKLRTGINEDLKVESMNEDEMINIIREMKQNDSKNKKKPKKKQKVAKHSKLVTQFKQEEIKEQLDLQRKAQEVNDRYNQLMAGRKSLYNLHKAHPYNNYITPLSPFDTTWYPKGKFDEYNRQKQLQQKQQLSLMPRQAPAYHLTHAPRQPSLLSASAYQPSLIPRQPEPMPQNPYSHLSIKEQDRLAVKQRLQKIDDPQARQQTKEFYCEYLKIDPKDLE